ncbi:MAG TPA: methylated-DNA--[protein]-cysteine S-methyltransferase [Jatrophihabitans sp.]|nr:methylated-DNA--[protein]-cysteine S-methyltransferase [Jatrophihabitans sp.]
MTEFALFDTAIGTCGIAWTEHGISDVLLPGRTVEATRRMLADRYGAAAEARPPAGVAGAITAIARLLDGEPEDLGEVVLDLARVPEFNRQVYAVARTIPPGGTLCYGDIAVRIGQPGAARAVGRAMGDNPCPIVIPCHRVLAADGSVHGFSAHGGIATKRRMLQIEGALAPDEPTLF